MVGRQGECGGFLARTFVINWQPLKQLGHLGMEPSLGSNVGRDLDE